MQAKIAAAKLNAYWSQMRLAKSDVIGLSLVKALSYNIKTDKISSIPDATQSNCSTLLYTFQDYLDQKGKGGTKTFSIVAERSCNYVIGLSGDKPLSSYTRHDAIMLEISHMFVSLNILGVI